MFLWVPEMQLLRSKVSVWHQVGSSSDLMHKLRIDPLTHEARYINIHLPNNLRIEERKSILVFIEESL